MVEKEIAIETLEIEKIKNKAEPQMIVEHDGGNNENKKNDGNQSDSIEEMYDDNLVDKVTNEGGDGSDHNDDEELYNDDQHENTTTRKGTVIGVGDGSDHDDDEEFYNDDQNENPTTTKGTITGGADV
eukprot:249288_1